MNHKHSLLNYSAVQSYIDMTVKKAQKGSLYENYFGCACVDRKTKTDAHRANASEGISCF